MLAPYMVWYGMVNVDFYSAIITKVSNALNTLVSGEKPGFQTLSEGLVVLLCAEVVRQGVPDHGAVHIVTDCCDICQTLKEPLVRSTERAHPRTTYFALYKCAHYYY